MTKPIQKKLPNGTRLIFLPLKDSLSVALGIFVEAGAAYEHKNVNGVSHFLEHMMFKGTQQRPDPSQISIELENLGASYNAFTDFDLTGYHATVAPQHFKKALGIIADLYAHPLLKEEEIKKEKGVIVEEIKMYEDLPRHKVAETLDELMYGDQPAGRSIAGTPRLVSSFTRDDIASYRNLHYVGQKTVVVIAGNFDPAQAAKLCKTHLGSIKKGKRIGQIPFKKHARSHIRIASKKLDQSHFMAGFHAVPFDSPERFKVSLLAKVLGGGMGSRLFQKIREEMGAAYYIGASNANNTSHGVLYIQGGINHAKLPDVFTALIEEIKKMRSGVSTDELNRAREYTIGNFLLSLETPEDLVRHYGYQAATSGKLQTPQDIVRELKKVTPRDIQQAARSYFTKDNFHFALVGPYAKKDEKKYEEAYKKIWK